MQRALRALRRPRLPVRLRRTAAPLLLLSLLAGLAAGMMVACASKTTPDQPAYDSEEQSNPEMDREERDWEDRDSDL